MATIHRTLERAGLNVKHIQKLAAERDSFLRADFQRHIGQYPANYIISIDEVSKDDRTYTRLWGRAQVGRRVEQHDPFIRQRRYSMIAALALDEGIIASRVLEGSFHHDTFLEYLRDDVVSIQSMLCYSVVSRLILLCYVYTSSLSQLHFLGQRVFFSWTMPVFITQKKLPHLCTASGVSLSTFPLFPRFPANRACIFGDKVSSSTHGTVPLYVPFPLL